MDIGGLQTDMIETRGFYLLYLGLYIDCCILASNYFVKASPERYIPQ